MSEYLAIIAVAEAIFIFFLLFLLIFRFKSEVKEKKQESGWNHEQKKSNRIQITNIALEDVNKWENPQIKLWLANPIGIGRRVDDKQFPLEGKVIDPPTIGSVKIFVLLSETEKWYQGQYPLNSKGEWKGLIYLSIGEGQDIKKIIRIELYDGISDNSNLLDTKDVIIE
ncbi:MAG: hypothetical protein KA120_03460 [Candidatus Goldbacteria bacterium]|nr:hypothetical protein [Candidatus Goldiibacteriota bacterium]